MKPTALFASLLLSVATYSADTMSAAPVASTVFSVENATGEMPIRNVVVKRSGEYFTTYLAYKFDCAGQKFSQTGFYSSPEAALAEVSKTVLADSTYSSLSAQARLKACEPNSNLGFSEYHHQPTAP